MTTPIRAPRANAFAERFVRTVRTKCPDHVLVYGRRHLERVLRSYVAHYIKGRPHRGLGLTTPSGRQSEPPGTRRTVERRDVLAGLNPRVSVGGVNSIGVSEPFRRD